MFERLAGNFFQINHTQDINMVTYGNQFAVPHPRMQQRQLGHTVFDLITAPALMTAPPWPITWFSLIIAHLTIFWH